MLQLPRPGEAPSVAQPRPRALLCFSHLRWSFVWQRPQHLLTRFAKEMPVYLVEEPEFVADAGAHSLRLNTAANVTILTPLIAGEPDGSWGFNDRTNPAIARLLARTLASSELASPDTDVIVWYYTPMALGALPVHISPSLTVFDAMDELAAFAGAPAGLRDREAELMRRADLVFTGGPSLFRARQHRHPRVHCFPSGVDASHFGSARDVTRLPDEFTGVNSPVLGYHGVLDERLDRDLLAGIADARPDWKLVFVGPVVKIAPSDLPQRPNILYTGQRSYAQLPGYLAAFDAAMLPFALNEATRFISPTKTLEYMAAGKPVVSTPIRDVIDLYGEVVAFAMEPAPFVEAVETLWSEPPADRARRTAAARGLLTAYDWDVIHAGMRSLIEDRFAARSSAPVGIGVGTSIPFTDDSLLTTSASD